MVKVSEILFSAAVFGAAAAAAFGFSAEGVSRLETGYDPGEACDTVTYPVSGYKIGRKGTFEEFILNDSLYAGMTFTDETVLDTLPKLTARDTIKAPDSLRLTDPFRYKYYVALLDSLTHVQVRDSLKKSEKQYWEELDTLHARADSCDWRKIDSIYFADSTVRARAAFAAWYASLDKDARKKYDYEQKVQRKMHEMDSLKKVHDEKQALKDSITENTPRILETFFIPDSMWYKRIITWKTDSDFHHMEASVPDTSYNYHFNDYAFRRNDVNSTWLGVAGSPVQPFNYFKREGDSGVDFYTPMESWSFSPKTLPHYNSKTPYTELAYWGTLLAKSSKESDNIHVLTTQNITPELNFQFLYDKWGGNGILDNEEVDNRTVVTAINYVGKKYLLHAGYIHDRATRGENGGITDEYWIRDTSVDARETPIASTTAESNTVANTFFLEQQLRIPFNFIEKMKAAKDSTYVFNPDSLNRDITTAFIGHSSEYSSYNRYFTDKSIKTSDSLSMNKLDNKVFVRLQPWSDDGVVSKLNLGLGDYLKSYLEPGDKRHNENSLYLYGGVEGKLGGSAAWKATGKYVLLGNDAGNFSVDADAGFSFYPFRKAKHSPISLKAHFGTSLLEPNYYQKKIQSHFYTWDNDFEKTSVTKIDGHLDIPYWKMDASVGYALLGNNIYYDATGFAKQNAKAMSVLSASLRKEFTAGGFLHFDNRLLFQVSSDQEVVPVPTLAANLRYYVQFLVARDRKTRTQDVMVMQIGANAFCNTPWYMPAFNSNLGIFYNQQDVKYTGGPIIDAFVNIQWKRACIFIKFENVGMGWPLKSKDYFSAAHYINTTRSVKFGIFWPFYTQPGRHSHSHDTNSSSEAAPGGGMAGRPGLSSQDSMKKSFR